MGTVQTHENRANGAATIDVAAAMQAVAVIDLTQPVENVSKALDTVAEGFREQRRMARNDALRVVACLVLAVLLVVAVTACVTYLGAHGWSAKAALVLLAIVTLIFVLALGIRVTPETMLRWIDVASKVKPFLPKQFQNVEAFRDILDDAQRRAIAEVHDAPILPPDLSGGDTA